MPAAPSLSRARARTRPGLVHQLDIMMIGGPVITNQQNRHPHSSRLP